MLTINRQFLTLTPSYKYRSRQKNNSRNRATPSNVHRHRSLKAYRAYDKQDLLQQIENKLQQQIKAQEENKILKEEMNKVSNWCGQDKMWSSGQIQMMMVSIQEENHQLNLSLEQKKKELDKLKKSPEYCQYRETEVSYVRLKEELNRLKAIVKERKKKKIEQRRTYTKQVNEQLSLIVDKERDIRQIQTHNQQLKAYLASMQEELDHYKNKNKQLKKNKRKLLEDSTNLKMKLHPQHSSSKETSSEQYGNEFFKLAIKTKSSKQSPAIIVEVLEESEMSPEKKYQKPKNQENEKKDSWENSEESSNQQTQSAHSDPGSMFQERKVNDSF